MTKLQRRITKYRVMRLCRQLYQRSGAEALNLVSECVSQTFYEVRLGKLK